MKLTFQPIMVVFATVSVSCSEGPSNTIVKLPETNQIAEIKEATGDVKIKRARTASWYKLQSDFFLGEGDEIFTGPNGKVKVGYKFNDAEYEMEPYSILSITRDRPEKTKFNKGNKKTKFNGQIDSTYYGINLGLKRKENPDGPNKLSLDQKPRRKRKIEIIEPGNNILVLSRKFPTTIAIKVEARWIKQNIWYYLWDISNMDFPVFTDSSLGSHTNLIIPKQGSYTLLLVSEDRTSESIPIEIQAESRNDLQQIVSPVLRNLNKNYVVVVQ